MITDRETNQVWFSKKLTDREFSEEYAAIVAILDECRISYGLLEDTNDIWCRDYMPV